MSKGENLTSEGVYVFRKVNDIFEVNRLATQVSGSCGR